MSYWLRSVIGSRCLWLVGSMFLAAFLVDYVSERTLQNYLDGHAMQQERSRLKTKNQVLEAELSARHPFEIWVTEEDRKSMHEIISRALDTKNRTER